MYYCRDPELKSISRTNLKRIALLLIQFSVNVIFIYLVWPHQYELVQPMG